MNNLQNSDLYEWRFRTKERKENTHFIGLILVIFIVLFSFRAWWTNSFGGVVVDGNSMNMTLLNGEKLLMRYADRYKKAERGDIIVVYVGGYEECATVNGSFLIKRLIAVEGDKVRCSQGQVEIMYAGTSSWTDLYEPYAYYGEQDAYKTFYNFSEYEVKEGEIFFLGDNRSSSGSSLDSRYKETPKMSHLNELYKVKDVYGVVPSWALEHQVILEKIFF